MHRARERPRSLGIALGPDMIEASFIEQFRRVYN